MGTCCPRSGESIIARDGPPHIGDEEPHPRARSWASQDLIGSEQASPAVTRFNTQSVPLSTVVYVQYSPVTGFYCGIDP